MSIDWPVGVTETTGPGGLTCYDIETDTCRGRVFLLGATVTSWAPAGEADVLWVSDESAYRVGRSIRGGIPICAPWFGAGRGVNPVPQAHGFVRDMEWRLANTRVDGDVVELSFELDAAAVADQPGAEAYPADLEFRYVVRFGTTLDVTLSVTSPNETFVLDEALHTYFAVSDVRTARVTGLDGAFYLDKAPGGVDQVQRGDVTFTAETDRVFISDATCWVLDGDRRVRIDKTGSASTVVWNPWIDKAAAMSEFGDDEWTTMLCVETANALDQAVLVQAGHTAAMSATLRVER